MADRKEYANLTVKMLRDLAKGLNISGRWEMTKGELVDAIIRANVVSETDDGAKSATEEGMIDNQNLEEDLGSKNEKNPQASTPIDMEKRIEYIEKVSAGTLVAFRLPSGKVISAKIKRKSTKRKMLMVETSYGAEHLVSFEDVIWVRTGKRWPRGVYNLLKGIKENA